MEVPNAEVAVVAGNGNQILVKWIPINELRLALIELEELHAALGLQVPNGDGGVLGGNDKFVAIVGIPGKTADVLFVL